MQSGSLSNLAEILWPHTCSWSLVNFGVKLFELESGQRSVTEQHANW